MALLARITSDPAWKRAQASEEDRRYLELVCRLLAWDERSEELPPAGQAGQLSNK